MGLFSGLKDEGVDIRHHIDTQSATKIGLALFGSSLAILIISTVITAFTKR